jgi:hypothetical protein
MAEILWPDFLWEQAADQGRALAGQPVRQSLSMAGFVSPHAR